MCSSDLALPLVSGYGIEINNAGNLNFSQATLAVFSDGAGNAAVGFFDSSSQIIDGAIIGSTRGNIVLSLYADPINDLISSAYSTDGGSNFNSLAGTISISGDMRAWAFGQITPAPISATAQVDGKLVCPNARREGARLVCEVQLANYGCSEVKITRGTAMFVGNSGGTLFGMGIYGPFVRGILTNKTIPAGDAGECAANFDRFAITPGTFTSQILIIDPVPAGIAPTAGTARVQMELTDLNPGANLNDAKDSISVEASVQVLPSL